MLSGDSGGCGGAMASSSVGCSVVFDSSGVAFVFAKISSCAFPDSSIWFTDSLPETTLCSLEGAWDGFCLVSEVILSEFSRDSS